MHLRFAPKWLIIQWIATVHIKLQIVHKIALHYQCSLMISRHLLCCKYYKHSHPS